MRVRLTLETDDAVAMKSPYDRAFVEGLKQALPWDGRSWDAQRKLWLVSPLYVRDLLAYLRQVGAEIQDDRPVAVTVVPPPPMPPELREAFDVLYLAYTAPLCVAEGSYRALSKHYHPDKGGDPHAFHCVNDAMTTIRRYLDPKPEFQEDDNDDLPF